MAHKPMAHMEMLTPAVKAYHWCDMVLLNDMYTFCKLLCYILHVLIALHLQG